MLATKERKEQLKGLTSAPQMHDHDGRDERQADRPVDSLSVLQRSLGNCCLEAMGRSAMHPEGEPVPQISNHSNSATPSTQSAGNQPVLQAKLLVGAPGDVYEQEADRVADLVMYMPDPAVWTEPVNPIQPSSSQPRNFEPGVQTQRQEAVEEVKTLQTKELSGQVPEVSPDLEARIQSQRGSGQPLPPVARMFFEPRFGHDFSGVRIHADTNADQLNDTLNASAFTTGEDIFFRRGEYNPDGSSGYELLAHELTHVVQQAGAPRPKFTIGSQEERSQRKPDQGAQAMLQREQHVVQKQIDRKLTHRQKEEKEEPVQTRATEIQVQRSEAFTPSNAQIISMQAVAGLSAQGTDAIFGWLRWYTNNMAKFYGQTSSAPLSDKTIYGAMVRDALFDLGKEGIKKATETVMETGAKKAGIGIGATIAGKNAIKLIGSAFGFVLGTFIVALIDVAMENSGEYYARGSKESAEQIRAYLQGQALPAAEGAIENLGETVRQLNSLIVSGDPELTKPEEEQSIPKPSTTGQSALEEPPLASFPIKQETGPLSERDLVELALAITDATEKIKAPDVNNTSLYEKCLRQWVLETSATPSESREGVVKEQWEEAKKEAFPEGLKKSPDLFVFQTLAHWTRIGLNKANAPKYEEFMREKIRFIEETNQQKTSDVAPEIVGLFKAHKFFRFSLEDVADAKKFLDFIKDKASFGINMPYSEMTEWTKKFHDRRVKFELLCELALDSSEESAYVDKWLYTITFPEEGAYPYPFKEISAEFDASP